MPPPKAKHGGAGRGQGRKSLAPGEDTVPVVIRMTKGQKEKLKRLGGAPWVRDRVDEAEEPKD